MYGMLYSNNYDVLFCITISIYCALNLAITIIGIYSIQKLMKESVSYYKRRKSDLFTTKELDSVYWATVLVCAIINIVCTVLEYRNFNIALAVYGLPIKFVIFLIEIISIWINMKIRDSICCFTNRYVLRIIHTLAICSILWFLHRVVCSLLVAIFFIALAPAQTLAVISLIYFVILCTIAYVSFNIHFINKMRCCTQRSCKIGCKLFILFMLFICVIDFFVCLTLIFNYLADNGLTSSGLGSVVLSLVAPTIVFVITLQLKQYLLKHFKYTSEINSDENVQSSKETMVNTQTWTEDDVTEMTEIDDTENHNISV